MLEHDPIGYLKKEKLEQNQISEKAKKALDIYQKMKDIHERNPSNEEMLKNANKTGANAMKILAEEAKKINGTTTARKESLKKKTGKRKASMEVVKDTPKVIDKLEHCKNLIKEENKRQRESGEIPKRKKKTRTTLVKEAFAKIMKLMPSSDAKVIEATERELRKCSLAIFKLNGLNQIAPIEKSIKEEAQKKTKGKKTAA